MALITSKADLSQGALTSPTDAVWGTPTGAQVTISSVGSELPTIGAGDYFEVRDHSDPENNGLYLEDGGSPATSSITASKVDGVDPIANAVGEDIRTFGTTATPKSVHYDTGQSLIYLLEQGSLSVDGVNGKPLYSFTKDEWKADNDLIKFAFPMFSVDADAGKYEFGLDGVNLNDWRLQDVTSPAIQSRKLMRQAGWRENENDGTLRQEWANFTTLGDFEDPATDIADYQQGDDPTDTAAAVPFTFAGPVNEAVLVYHDISPVDTGTGYDFTDGGGGDDTIDRNDGGSFITEGYKVGATVTVLDATTGANDGDYVITSVATSSLGVPTGSITADTADQTVHFAKNFRNEVKLKLRVRDADPKGKTYAQADLAAGGHTVLGNRVFAFPLANAPDQKIDETDANIDANQPYPEIRIRYLPTAYNREVDTTTKRAFGIVVDVGTYSQSNGASATSTTFTSADWNAGVGEALADYAGGTLIIHEGTDQGTHIISGTPTAPGGVLTVVLTVALTATESALSFTMQRATPVAAVKQEIYEKVQRSLRQAADIDGTIGVVTGKTADELAVFEGENLFWGKATPENPNGGGSGVIVEGFDSNDTNSQFFFDNIPVQRNFPFVAAGGMQFSQNLVDDPGPAEYWMFFLWTERFTNTGFGLSSSSGETATLDSSVTDLTAELADGDYINLTGWTNPALDGTYVLTGTPAGAGPWTATVRRVDRTTLADEAAAASINLDKNPIETPDAIVVDNNSGTDIQGNVTATSISFDFDYDGNVQGGRTAASDAEVQVIATGTSGAQYSIGTGTITRDTGLSIAVVSAAERNYEA